jgi:ATP-binding cassette, subfamily B, bacterial
MLLSHLKLFFRQLPAGRRALALVWEAARGWTVAWGVMLVAQGIIPAGQALFLRTLFNRLAAGQGWAAVAPPAVGIAGLWMLGQILSSGLSWVRTVQAERVQDNVYRLIHRQALRVDLAIYDNPDYYDQLYRAKFDALSQPMALLESLGSLVQNSLGFLVLAAILWKYAGWLPLLLVVTGFPGLLLVARHILHKHRWQLEHTAEQRKVDYLDDVITDRAAAAELRLFDLGSYFRTAFETVRGSLREGRLRLERQSALTELWAGTLAWLGSLVGLGWMLNRTLKGRAGVGDLVLCFQAFQQSQTFLRAILEGAGKTYRSLLFVENLEEFLGLNPKILPGPSPDPGLPLKSSIRFENVSFTYPGGFHLALDGFNMEIPQGKVVALVGHNGSGKSTLIKLLCRFYDPDRGRILFDDVDLKAFDVVALRHRMAVLFQDPVHYLATVRENIAFGDLDGVPDQARVRQAAHNAGVVKAVESLPEQFETVLGKRFGGAELSGGEWQGIALARAFFRQASLVILDEPTSAMDSWAEQDWLGRFRALTEGRTALMITHRFTTAMHADMIHVLDKGRVVESGTHSELVERGGEYAASWSAQMREIDHA